MIVESIIIAIAIVCGLNAISYGLVSIADGIRDGSQSIADALYEDVE